MDPRIHALVARCVDCRCGALVVVPVTSDGSFACRRGFTVSLDDAGTRTAGVIRCDQPRTLDFAAGNGKRLESVPEPIMDEVLARLREIVA